MTTTPFESPPATISVDSRSSLTSLTRCCRPVNAESPNPCSRRQPSTHLSARQSGLDGTFLEVNPALCRITGFTKDELTGVTFQEITHPDDVDADVDQAVALAAGDIDSYVMDKRYIRADGSATWVQLHASVTRDDEEDRCTTSLKWSTSTSNGRQKIRQLMRSSDSHFDRHTTH